MKVLVNAISAKMGGFKTLINSFIENIDENDSNEYYFYLHKDSISKEFESKANVKIIESNVADYNYLERFFWYQIQLPRIIKMNKFDYMINFTNYGPIFPKCKQIILLHNSKHISEEIKKTLDMKQKIKLFIQDMVLRLSLLGTYKLVVQTDYMKSGIEKKFKYNKENIIVIPSAPKKYINDKIDYKLEDKINSFINEEKNVICDITLYAKHKNLELLLEAIKYIKDNKLMNLKLILTISFFGGEDTKRLLKMIEEMDIQDYVYSVGTIEHENIHQILEKSKIFVFPSYAESFGIPFVEAMKFGLPIIAADLGFAHDVCDKAARYFKYDNKIELAERIVEMLGNEQLRLEISKNSIVRGEIYDEQKIVVEYLKLLS